MLLHSIRNYNYICSGALCSRTLRNRPVAAAPVSLSHKGVAPVSAMAHDTVDLTISDSEGEAESPTAAAARDAAQRQSIMEFARAKRARTGDVDSVVEQQQGTTVVAATASTAAAAAQGAGTSSFGNSDLKALHEARMQRMRAQDPAAAASAGAGADAAGSSRGGSSQRPRSAGAGASASDAAGSRRAAASPGRAEVQKGSGRDDKPVTLLSYNVWFREDVALSERMQGISNIISTAGYPTFLCFQEVTPLIMRMFASMPWWKRYACSPAPSDAPYFTLLLVNKTAAPATSSSSFEEVHFDNSCMGRSLQVATVTVSGRKLLVATSHLESPIPPHQWYSRERQQQMGFSLAQLQKAPYGNVLFAGDMNWTDSRDGAPPLPAGWCDVWQKLHPGDDGFTYDSKNNPMLPYKNSGLRLDRIFARLTDFQLGSISIVGKEPLEGASYRHTFKSGGSKQLPVLPSDHFGLLLQLNELPLEMFPPGCESV